MDKYGFIAKGAEGEFLLERSWRAGGSVRIPWSGETPDLRKLAPTVTQGRTPVAIGTIVIEATGSSSMDIDHAFAELMRRFEAKELRAAGITRDAYTAHHFRHLGRSGRMVMQIVKKTDHKACLPHSGGMKQFYRWAAGVLSRKGAVERLAKNAPGKFNALARALMSEEGRSKILNLLNKGGRARAKWAIKTAVTSFGTNETITKGGKRIVTLNLHKRSNGSLKSAILQTVGKAGAKNAPIIISVFFVGAATFAETGNARETAKEVVEELTLINDLQDAGAVAKYSSDMCWFVLVESQEGPHLKQARKISKAMNMTPEEERLFFGPWERHNREFWEGVKQYEKDFLDQVGESPFQGLGSRK